MGQTVFKNGQFWYYNKTVYGASASNPVDRSTIDFNKTIQETDVIVLCYTESTLQTLGNGFLDELYNYYRNNTKFINPDREKDIKNFIDYINTDKAWVGAL